MLHLRFSVLHVQAFTQPWAVNSDKVALAWRISFPAVLPREDLDIHMVYSVNFIKLQVPLGMCRTSKCRDFKQGFLILVLV